MTRSASASVDVSVDPATAFRAFTEEIDQWWVPGPINAWDFGRAIGRRIEPGVGGRVLEVYDGATGDGLELGRITVWEPGRRLVYRSSVDDTEVDVRFDAIDGGTRVRVEHAVLPGGDADRAALFWPNVIRWLEPWCRERDAVLAAAGAAGGPGAPGGSGAPGATRAPAGAAGSSGAPGGPGSRPRRRLARLAVGLNYRDPAAAARWLADVFGLRSWDRIPAEGDRPSWIELHVGDVAVLLFPVLDWAPEPVSHGVWVYVDDLDAHFAHASAKGAAIVSGIRKHGYRAYVADDLEGHRWTFVQASPLMRA